MRKKRNKHNAQKGNEMIENIFQCAYCKGVFEKQWSDEAAYQEYVSSDFYIPDDNIYIVCDDCYIKMRNNYGMPNH
jgi:hypothetical protein